MSAATQEGPSLPSGGAVDGPNPVREGPGVLKGSAGRSGRTASALVRECMDCAKLPAEAVFDPRWRAVPTRPRIPRKIDSRSGPRSPRCTTHYRAKLKVDRARAAAKRSCKRAGVDEETRQAVKAFQGDKCPCGARLLPMSGKRLEPDADHDHELAVMHDHPEDVACPECFRGFLCRHCNREVIGFLSHSGTRDTAAVIAALRCLASYLEDPPARRWRREEGVA